MNSRRAELYYSSQKNKPNHELFGAVVPSVVVPLPHKVPASPAPAPAPTLSLVYLQAKHLSPCHRRTPKTLFLHWDDESLDAPW